MGALFSIGRFQSALLCLVVALTTALLAVSAHSDISDAAKLCKSDNAKQAILGCTRLINSSIQKPEILSAAHAIRAGHLASISRDLAIIDYDLAIAHAPSVGGYFRRGYHWFHKSGYDNAIADFDRALLVTPANERQLTSGERRVTLTYRGLAEIANGNFSRALRDCSEAIAIDPTAVSSLNCRAQARYFMNEDLAGALSDADEALRFSPNDDQAYQTRGQIKLATGDYEGALADLSASIEQSGASATSLTYSGLAHAGAGSIWKARADFELALSSPRKGYVFEVAAALAIAKQKLQQIDDRFDARWKRTVKRINDWYFELVGPAFSLNFNVKSSSDQSSASDAVIVFDSPTPVGLCIFPVPRVTQKLLARAAERPEEADAIESNIEALAAQYCRMHHQVPKSDYDEDIGSSCTMHTGVLNNERVYWASCSGN